ncbi:MAG: hypothetical protein ACRC1R_11485 [Cetobacterium sp.]|uniref:hypothetical protein n=1 Tax=Cetobacterium sp. TaxID=2071632 RepID=UPI003F328CAF
MLYDIFHSFFIKEISIDPIPIKNFLSSDTKIKKFINGIPQNQIKGIVFKTDLATAYLDSRLVVTKETLTVEGMIKIVYDLLKDKLNIVKITFSSGVNAGSEEFTTKNSIERCPLCGIALNEKNICTKCDYKK